MKRILLAVLVGAGFALYGAPASADEPARPTTPAVTSATPVVITEATASPRRGIFARLRERRMSGTVITAPTTGTVVPPTVTTPAPKTTVPSPLPSVKPVSGTTTTGDVTTAAYSETPTTRTGIFGRLRNRNNSTTTSEPMTLPMSAVVPASGTVTMPMMTETVPTTQPRQGLFARMRARRG